MTLVYFLIQPWKASVASTLEPLRSLYQTGLENGDNEYAAWAITIHCHYSYLAGHSLEKLATKIAHYRASVSQLQQHAASNYLGIYQQVLLNLLGDGDHSNNSDQCDQLEGEAYSEAKMLPIQLAASDRTGLCYTYLNKGILAYLFSRPQAAQQHFDHALCYSSGISSSQWMPALLFYDSLSCLAIGNIQQLPRVIVNQEQLKTWARLAPMNHLHRWHLVEAERCRLSGEKAIAIDHYDQAIALAQANEFVQEEALANEIAAQFYLLWGKGRIAQSYLIDAYYGYSQWGEKAKIADLERRYPMLLAAILQGPQQNLSSTDTILAYANTTHTSTNTTSAADAIDLTTLLHTSQVLSSEMELDGLLSTLLEAVIQNAGAEKCILLMPKSEENQLEAEWVIEALAELDQPPVLLTSQPIKPGKEVPLSLINQVKHTCEPTIVFNAAVHASLAVDPYVLRHQPKSILCAPILSQGKLIAILYLENNLTIGAFTGNRVEVLNLICTQAAISLENARLYHQTQCALSDLKNSHIQLVQNEKMSALGNLVAGIAHEINNPVNFLKGNLKPALSYVKDLLGVLDLVLNDEPREMILEEMEEINFAFVQEDLLSLLHSMTFGISRISDISNSLRTFSRADTDYKVAFNLHEGLDSTLLILKHRLSAGESCPPIEVVKNYGELPNIFCFAGQLNQVFMNLVANAIDAIEEHNQQRSLAEVINNPSRIVITTALADSQWVTIRVTDNGPGMDADVQARVFDHLFTTKPVGKGTGLGLAIAYAIVVEKHGGTLTVDSEVGKGTVFEITLPVEH
ncbi:MAG: hypothetical protein DCF15_11000 [Phormidesmis priestleyi]|uniref:histidine kinase n=1 Tax=Phormidesmis priestleyi TaxID=268141 RepID=A0A2W4XLB6_9CYAN|nr:MAG: hypothetical protein DCF15_11000 [Phormidesmis priestleyi]